MGAVKRINATSDWSAVILIRLLVGWVFLSEGIGKFLYPGEQAGGRFEKIPAIPWPHFFGPFVGIVEIVCGAMLLAGLLTRLAAIALLVDITVAIVTTKVPILAGHHYGIPALKHYNFWGMLHEARTDFSMFLGLVFLLVTGGGRWSIDSRLLTRRRE
jgi:uncharacterized membrane protein YphA (DoxX/SURF4 family)